MASNNQAAYLRRRVQRNRIGHRWTLIKARTCLCLSGFVQPRHCLLFIAGVPMLLGWFRLAII